MENIKKISINGTIHRIGYSDTGLFPVEAKEALLDLVENIVYTTDQSRELIDALKEAVFVPVGLAGISAVFTQGEHEVMDTDNLDTLRPYLDVTAHFVDGSAKTVVNYALIGNLYAPSSTVTVAYGGETTTFTVVVSTVLPDGYVHVPWVASLNTSSDGPFVNTQVSPSANGPLVVKLGFMPTEDDNTGSHQFISSRVGGSGFPNTTGFCIQTRHGDTVVDAFNGLIASIYPRNGDSLLGVRLDVEATFTPTSAYITDGTLYESVTGTGRSPNDPIYLFGLKRNNESYLNYQAKGRIYYANVVDNDTEILNLLPCRVVASGVVGFYDTVNERFITAVGLTAPEVE